MHRSVLGLALLTIFSPLLLSARQKPDEPRPAATPVASGTPSSSDHQAAAATPTPRARRRHLPHRTPPAARTPVPAATPSVRGTPPPSEPDRSPAEGDSSRPKPVRTPGRGELPHTGHAPRSIERTPPAVDENPKNPPADEAAPDAMPESSPILTTR